MPNNDITVYTTTGCQPCRLTKKLLDDTGTTYTEHDITDNPTMQASLRAAGHREMPVVVTHHEVWTGFRPGKIRGAIHGKT